MWYFLFLHRGFIRLLLLISQVHNINGKWLFNVVTDLAQIIMFLSWFWANCYCFVCGFFYLLIMYPFYFFILKNCFLCTHNSRGGCILCICYPLSWFLAYMFYFYFVCLCFFFSIIFRFSFQIVSRLWSDRKWTQNNIGLWWSMMEIEMKHKREKKAI